MKIEIFENPVDLGKTAAKYCAEIINEAIARKGEARVVFSTAASQFETFKALIELNIDWTKVEVFHLDEYIGLPEGHPASFAKFLEDRFLCSVTVKKAHLIDGRGDTKKVIEYLTREIRKAPIDLGLIGIGENAHIAFNDPPADFGTEESYICVALDDVCKQQQVGEGWFPTFDDVPKQAISMTAHQIMQIKRIISIVPHAVKAKAIKATVETQLTNMIPATLLKKHPEFLLLLDKASASLLDSSKLQ